MAKNDLLMIGELAKKMKVSIRTLQYYDKEGLLKPSAISEGGRRLYSNKDIIKLHQILSFKYLGFSLGEIRDKLFSLDDPQEVINVLEFQKSSIENQISILQSALAVTITLKSEILEIGKVDFAKYAEVIEMLKIGNEGYWAWKNFDNSLKDHLRSRFAENADEGLRIYETYKSILEQALILKKQSESPVSEKSLALAKKWWDMVMDFTGGDMSLIPKLEKFNNDKNNWNNDLADKQKEVESFLESALTCYLSKLNCDL